MFHVPNDRRVAHPFDTPGIPAAWQGNNGAFVLQSPEPGWQLIAIASDGDGWEHVSVHASSASGKRLRVPSWREMCFAKDAFWEPNDVVMQLHPTKREYVNVHPFTLHLWRPIDVAIPLPPRNMV